MPSEDRPPSSAGDQPEVGRGRPPDVDAVRHCPHLGWNDDPATHALFPSAAHRCFARRRAWPVPQGWQVALCLDQFERCTIYMASSRRMASDLAHGPVAPATLPQRLRRWLWVALLTTLLVSTGSYVAARAYLHHQAVIVLVLTCSAVTLVLSLGIVARLSSGR